MPISRSGGHQPEGWWVILSGGGAFSNDQALGTTGDMPAGESRKLIRPKNTSGWIAELSPLNT